MSVRVDRVSLLADAAAETRLETLEATLATGRLTLRIAPEAWEVVRTLTVGDWLALGAPGAPDPWRDPADHLVAGLEAELTNGRTLVVRPAPRRATGPDLVALVAGARGRFAKVRRAWIRVHRTDAKANEGARFESERDAAVSKGEEELLGRIERALGEG